MTNDLSRYHSPVTELFTRIKDEKEQCLIRDFLAQQTEQTHERP